MVPGGPGKLAMEIEGAALRDRKSRIEWLRDHAGPATDGQAAVVCDATLDELRTLRRDLQEKIKAADLIFITAQEIDEVGESDNITLARAIMDMLLSNLARGLRRLGDLGCQTIIVAADHGYLFGDEAGDDMKVAPPGGQQYDLHRRVWVGRGGTANPAYLRTPLAALGVGASEVEVVGASEVEDDDAEEDDDLDLATPWGFGVFRAPGGASAYFHGGLSLPELVMPTLTITPHTQGAPQASDEFEWTLSLGSKKISTRFCTVQVSGRFNGLFATNPAPVRLEIRSGAQTLSTAVAATYGFEEATRDIQMALDTSEGNDTRELQPNTVTLMLNRDDLASGSVTLHLLDATAGRELARLDDIEMAIAL